ncbi:glycosyltransferase family 2 protein [Candidatus Sumerlaeota bacterium]|nr:glycosyltransferase family 2 protein [Candidatus Sumerlaeota bacterium]
MADEQPPKLLLSIVIPFYNEEENVGEVCEEVQSILNPQLADSWELVAVNDGSRDKTGDIIDRLAEKYPNLKPVHLVPNSGQSAALEAGFRAARGEIVGTLDGDGQNDPSDLFKLIEEMKKRGVDMMCGIRTKRADNWVRRTSSRIANKVRASILGDHISDVGCSMRVFRRSIVRNVGFFRNSHRYFPALVIMRGYTVAEMPVNHRPRSHGSSKYGGGINSRLWVGIVDLMGVWWLKKRSLKYKTRVRKP